MSDSPTELMIRKATVADAAGVSALMRGAYTPYLSRVEGPLPPLEANYAEEIERRQTWVMDEGGAIIGALFLDVAEDHMVLVNVAVSPDHQGRGLGRPLDRKGGR